eukprot:CAMPEP_0119259704 /NCGR_PEP_ID=MMETSP1329-20130426/419_1 /TAXON_ID=114041 /ORGANISM="Genus nov. species nov., Strain RCC1024" /LENGTH=203 /DNA_ID=CAMNT_0007259103 /DNA_START=189 /DNA_END=797 /DNA_ORIENTATION=+
MQLAVVLALATCARALVPPALNRVAAAPLKAETADVDVAPALTDAQENALKKELEFRTTKYFFGRVDVYLGPQYKPLSEIFDPTLKDDSTAMASVVVETPIGMVIEESGNYAGRVEVVEVVEGSNAEKAGVQVGDILRGTTAMALNIQQSAEEDFGFSVGLSEGTKQRAFFPTDRKKFEAVMAALQSNAPANSGPGEATLVFE